MTKLLAGIFFGVFIGSLAFELINRRNPELLEKARKFAKDTATGDILPVGGENKGWQFP